MNNSDYLPIVNNVSGYKLIWLKSNLDALGIDYITNISPTGQGTRISVHVNDIVEAMRSYHTEAGTMDYHGTDIFYSDLDNDNGYFEEFVNFAVLSEENPVLDWDTIPKETNVTFRDVDGVFERVGIFDSSSVHSISFGDRYRYIVVRFVKTNVPYLYTSIPPETVAELKKAIVQKIEGHDVSIGSLVHKLLIKASAYEGDIITCFKYDPDMNSWTEIVKKKRGSTDKPLKIIKGE